MGLFEQKNVEWVDLNLFISFCGIFLDFGGAKACVCVCVNRIMAFFSKCVVEIGDGIGNRL